MPTRKEFSYECNGPFAYGTNNSVCVHGWNCSHLLTDEEAQHSDMLTNCGLLPARQRIEKISPTYAILPADPKTAFHAQVGRLLSQGYSREDAERIAREEPDKGALTNRARNIKQMCV